MKYEQATEFYLLYLKEVTRPFITTYPHFYSYLSSSFLTFSSILSILFYSILFYSILFIPLLYFSRLFHSYLSCPLRHLIPSLHPFSLFFPLYLSLSLSFFLSLSFSLSHSYIQVLLALHMREVRQQVDLDPM